MVGSSQRADGRVDVVLELDGRIERAPCGRFSGLGRSDVALEVRRPPERPRPLSICLSVLAPGLDTPACGGQGGGCQGPGNGPHSRSGERTTLGGGAPRHRWEAGRVGSTDHSSWSVESSGGAEGAAVEHQDGIWLGPPLRMW